VIYSCPISTESQLSPVVCIICAIRPDKPGALSFIDPDAICWSSCDSRQVDYYSLLMYPAYSVCHLHCTNSSSTCGILDILVVTYYGVRWPLYWTFVTYMPKHPLRCNDRPHSCCLYTGKITTWL